LIAGADFQPHFLDSRSVALREEGERKEPARLRVKGDFFRVAGGRGLRIAA
jgi:hypothetical protein